MLSKIKKIIREPRKIKQYFRYFMGSFVLPKTTIRQINLELVNYCNLRCALCALDHVKEKQLMSEKLLRKLFDDLMSNNRLRRSVKTICLWNGGEVLLHPGLIDMLAIIKEYKTIFLKRGFSFPMVSLLTNGTPLSKMLSKELVDLEIVDLIRFSVDGGSREKYEEIRKGARWESLSRNIRDFVEVNRGRVKTGIICIVEYGKKLNTAWMSEEFRDLLKLVDCVELRYPHDWIGETAIEGIAERKPVKNSCKFLRSSLVVFPNGDVTVCCHDLQGIGTIGNLYQETLFRIYNAEKRRMMLHCVKKGERHKIALCKKCRMS